MASRITTESIESSTRVAGNIEAFDFFFLLGYVGVSYMFSWLVHERLRLIFLIYSALMALFLTWRSASNVKRRNYESLYLMITKSETTYRPYLRKQEDERNDE